MAITIEDLILFNNVESTDPIVGALQLPYYKTPAYVFGQTMSNGHSTYIRGDGSGRGSQILLRELGKGNVEHVKVDTPDALKFNHKETADKLITIQLDDVIKQSEEVYEAVESARQSATGAAKAQIVTNNIIEKAQELTSGYLVEGAIASAPEVLTAENAREVLIEERTSLDYVPDTLMVSKEFYGTLLQLTTTGDFTPNPTEHTFRTGILGTILGLNVKIDENLPANVDYVMYNHKFFSVFPVFESLDVVKATRFTGSYVRGLLLQGGYAPKKAHGEGSWAIKHLNKAD